MQFTIRTHTTLLGAAAEWLRAGWQGIANAAARWRLARQQYRACEQLDVHALRDLGLDRSEHGSYLAESSGGAMATRRRVATR